MTLTDYVVNCIILFLFVFLFSVPPLFVIEFLHRVVDTFTEYFNSCNETSIKENVVIVFEVRTNAPDDLKFWKYVYYIVVCLLFCSS